MRHQWSSRAHKPRSRWSRERTGAWTDVHRLVLHAWEMKLVELDRVRRAELTRNCHSVQATKAEQPAVAEAEGSPASLCQGWE